MSNNVYYARFKNKTMTKELRKVYMISRLKIEIDINDKQNNKANQNKIFNSILNDYSNNRYIELLGENKLKPYTHHIKRENDKLYWIINTLTDEARENIISPIIKNAPNIVYDKQNQIEVLIKDKTLDLTTYDNLISRNYLSKEKHNYITIKFNSPTSFSSQGSYKILPDIDLIYKSIVQKYNSFSANYEIDDDEVLDYIIQNTSIIDYNLRSVRFSMNNFRIPSFIGSIRLKIRGTDASKNLINLLIDFSTYSGIGIKTSLGMGGVDIQY